MLKFRINMVGLALFSFVLSYAKIATAEWRDVNYSSELMLHQVEPVGKEGNEYVYLCKAYPNGQDGVSGKLRWETGQVLCSVAYNDTEVTNHLNGYQIFTNIPGTASWVPTAGATMVKEGTNANQLKVVFACRAWVQGDLIAGAYNNDENSCYVVKDDKVVKVQENLEVLTQNQFGLFFN